ncbi:hypothetical protein HMPREF9533_03561 [Escherichia coli MS 60-1]|nr:hypothetical protein HMPREF9553_02570 [Escherichia coli MS 200-1]EGB81595.1 hypothetical protein HMPREF9533_03561 [Escherichia coli MS 60-1]ESE33722.1 hypothetical protein HMPREF1622_02884 [Escherichia coli A35218R]
MDKIEKYIFFRQDGVVHLNPIDLAQILLMASILAMLLLETRVTLSNGGIMKVLLVT